MVGIYRITSPTGKVYIGQSWNIKKRHYYYSTGNSCKEQPALSRSIKKHGFNNHKVDVICELPEDCTQQDLDNAEIVYIDLYKNAGFILLNMKGGGMGGRLSEESIQKMKEKRKGRKPTLGVKFSEESKARMSLAQKGRKLRPDQIERLRQINKGRKTTEETRIKLSKRQREVKTWTGRKHREESKVKQSLKKIGNKINNKLVLNIETGIFYDSLTDAAFSVNKTMKALSNMMRLGAKRKRNPFIYV